MAALEQIFPYLAKTVSSLLPGIILGGIVALFGLPLPLVIFILFVMPFFCR